MCHPSAGQKPSTIQERLASADAVEWVQDWLRTKKRKSRTALARDVCTAFELKDARGQLRVGGTLKALRVLEARGCWRLPKRQGAKPGSWQPRRLSRRVAAPRNVPARAEQVQGMCLVEVGAEQDELFRTWNELIESEHPLRDSRMVGRQLRYLISSEHGWLGALGFGSCALRLAPRDAWIGWDDPTRKRFQDRVLDMRRFLIRPSVRCENLASRVLSMAAERVGPDFARRYGFEPWLLESFVEADLGHKDATQRLVRIAQAKARNPSASYPECVAGNRHELKAYYRFIGKKHDRMNPADILSGHRRQTIRRIKGHRRVLAIQDTTDLDFSERLHCNDLGDIGKNQTGAVSHGLKMHSVLALSEEGLPLGVLGTHLYASHFDSEENARSRPIEEKESYRWLQTLDALRDISEWVPETELIAVGDRESDLFELFDYRRRKARNIHLLVRARYDRCLEEEPQKLFAHLETLPVMGEAHLAVPRQREKKGKPSQPGRIGLPARRAKVQLRWDKVTIRAPKTTQTRRLRAVELHAVLLTEIDPPQDAQPLHWVLLTTVPIESRKQALRCIRWYTRRWRIEEWHRVLKSGCHIEAHQHQSAAKLARAIAIDTVMAWRVMLLTLLGREAPEMHCEFLFEPWECRLLEQLQPWVAPETMRGQKKGRYTSPPPMSSSRDSAGRSTETTASCPDLKPSCADFVAFATSELATGWEKENP